MRDSNNESLSRKCENADSDYCIKEYFSARTRNQFYCSQKCRDDFNNRKKKGLSNNDLPIKTGIIIKLQSLALSNSEVFLTLEQIISYGIDMGQYDERTLLDTKNGRYVLRYGDFYFSRVDDNLFRILTKKYNYGKRIN